MNRPFSTVCCVAALGLATFMTSCFPTKDDNSGGNSSNPTDVSQSLIDGDSPNNLPADIAANTNTTESGIDSLFTVLVKRVESLDTISSKEGVYLTDFESLRKGFGAAVVASNNHVKANIGFIVSTILSLNGNTDIQRMIDSLDSYIEAMDDYFSVDPIEPEGFQKATARAHVPGLIGRILARQGLLPAGQALISQSPRLLKSQAMQPNFPRFLTVSYIQEILESDVVPRLNEVIAASGRLRAQSAMNLTFSTQEEQVELDVGDLHLFEAGARGARAGFAFLCIYDMNMHSPDGSTDMRWIDQMIQQLEISSDNITESTTFRLSADGDTLYEDSYSDMSEYSSYMTDVYQYNFKRTGFLGIRKNYFNAVYNDLKLVPQLLKTGIASIRSESDNQDNDLFASADILDMDDEMAAVSEEMIAEGISQGLASHFASPENLMDFISSLLVDPYTFDETIDGKTIRLTVDLSKFFTNPPNPLTEYWPKHIYPTGDDRLVTYDAWTSVYDEYGSESFSFWQDEGDVFTLEIAPAAIAEIDSSDEYYTSVYLVQPYSTKVNTFTMTMATPILFIDDKGKPLDYSLLVNMTESAENLSAGFPYFDDYTAGGIFPEMTTRQKWIDLLAPLLD